MIPHIHEVEVFIRTNHFDYPDIEEDIKEIYLLRKEMKELLEKYMDDVIEHHGEPNMKLIVNS